MKAVVCQDAELSIAELPEPQPGPGQVLLKVLRCGICGSDLHVRHHCNHMGQLAGRMGYANFPRADQPMVFGHEFCGEVIEHGPKTSRKLRAGTRVCAVPFLRHGTADFELIGWSTRYPGAYAERIIVEESMMVPVPNGLDADQAALTEPMAVALHAVQRAEAKKNDVAIVVGCGPVGLTIICILKARGVRTIIASDFSPGRRELARRCGAHVVIDPAKESPYENWEQYGFVGTLPGLLELAIGTREKLGKLPLPWWQVWRVAEKAGLKPKRPLVFECVGVPGVLQNIIEGAPLFSRVVVAGVCMQQDKIEPALAINKEIDLRFVLGYSPLEFRDALHMIAEGKVDCSPLISGLVGLEGVNHAFTALGNPEEHAKILIDPERMGAELASMPRGAPLMAA
ncbi:zinc-binding dehydrogenase [Variovorax humicola]|uniref:Zinc-binding dehydrogenase n=1 Tax=Variovorax humicola TaxID=1769758 RepID=A0ABU8VX56_9BURK